MNKRSKWIAHGLGVLFGMMAMYPLLLRAEEPGLMSETVFLENAQGKRIQVENPAHIPCPPSDERLVIVQTYHATASNPVPKCEGIQHIDALHEECSIILENFLKKAEGKCTASGGIFSRVDTNPNHTFDCQATSGKADKVGWNGETKLIDIKRNIALDTQLRKTECNFSIYNFCGIFNHE